MSRRLSLLRSFQSDAQLCQFFLKKAVPTGNELGIGSYGMVIEVEYNGKSCAAKKIHEILIQSGNEGIRDIIEKYRRECQLMASLQHPNITQFMGLCFLEESQLPLLVMEKLEMSVDDLLEYIPNIALLLKLSILTDTCKGLDYLHDRKLPIVHRDLSAGNVLLTSSLTAKIADLGNSRIVDFKPGQQAKTLSKNPGTTVYMPLEALNEIHRYGPSLDVFSFGHLTLYVLTQIFPGELLSAAYPNPDNPDHIIGRSEVKRRATYMSMLESTYGLYPELIEMVEQSLHNIPERRPLTKNLLSRLQDVKMKADRSDGMNKMKEHYISSILYVKELKEENSKRIKEFEISLERLETDYLESMSTNGRLEDEKREQYRIIETLRNEKEFLESDRSKFEAFTSQLKGQLQQLEGNLIDLKKQLEEKEQQLQHAHEELKRNTKSMDSVKSVESVKKDYHVTFPLQLDWKSAPDMPFSLPNFAQTVEVEGIVYVGALAQGSTSTVMAFDTQSCKWDTLPPYNAKWFAMTTINSRVTLVGGRYRTEDGKIGMWQKDIKRWIYPYPPMPTPRYHSSATAYKHWLVVAGGENDHDYLSTVEILELNSKQWSTGLSTPVPWYQMKSVIISDIWYLLGGKHGASSVSEVYRVSLEALISYSSPQDLPVWQTSTSLTAKLSCPLNVGAHLLAFGGVSQHNKTLSTIQHYVYLADTWVEEGKLPLTVQNCSCIVSSDKLYVMGGSNEGKHFKSVFFSCI